MTINPLIPELAQSVEQDTLNPRVVGYEPHVGHCIEGLGLDDPCSPS